MKRFPRDASLRMHFRFVKKATTLSSKFKKMEPLYYHSTPTSGKLTVKTIKKMSNIKDLSLAYSPGVAEPSLEIAKDPEDVYKCTCHSL